jgi:hypothetical protein
MLAVQYVASARNKKLITAIWDAEGLDCRKCSDGMKELKGCTEDTSAYFIGERQYTRCPLKVIDFATNEYIKLYNLFDKGVFPTNDGILEQSGKFFDVMTFIRNEVNRKQMQDAERMKKNYAR